MILENNPTDEAGTLETEKKGPEVCEKKEGMEKVIAMIEAQIAAGKEHIVVAVAGGSASGKGFISKGLLEHFAGETVALEMDDYFRDAELVARMQKGEEVNWDEPEAVNIAQAVEDLALLKSGSDVINSTNFFGTKPREDKTLTAKKIIIVDGLYALTPAVAELADVKVFADVSTHGRFMRRILRDIVRTGQPPAAIVKMFAGTVQPMHGIHVESTKENADIVIKNEYTALEEAERTGLHEKQLKFNADNISEDMLLGVGGTLIKTSEQADHYYNPENRNLTDTDEVMRVREEVAEGEGPQAILTYKGPRLEGVDTRERAKFEFDIDEETKNGFVSLYPDQFRTIHKTRKTFEIEGVLLTLDDVTGGDGLKIGKFLELRADSKSEADMVKVAEILKRLNVDIADATKKTYLEMESK